MIHELRSNLDSFKTLKFHNGLNVLLADKSSGATDRQSRNGAGKSSFVELVHFLLGSQAGPNSIFRSDPLATATFELTMDLAGERISVARSGARPARISVEGQLHGIGQAQQTLANGDDVELSNENWKGHLGALWFALSDDEVDQPSFPSFRSLFSMFARRQDAGGFQSPIKHTNMQSKSDQQVTVSYLIGLDWTISDRFKRLKSDEKSAQDLRKAMRSGEFGRQFGSVDELRTRLTVAEARTARLRTQIEQFQVVPEYREYEREASHITASIGELNVQNVADRELFEELSRSLQMEELPAQADLSRLYQEAGIVLPELVRHRLEDVERFHSRIVENRRAHLESEISATRMRMDERERRKIALSERRAKVMSILEEGGALEHFTKLQEELARRESECEGLRQKLETGQQLDATQTRLKVQRNVLMQALRDDIHERRALVGEAVLAFEELSQWLYEEEGQFIVSTTPTGPDFEVHIAGERSKGINSMQIFCFDFMLATLGVRQGRWPGFLIHDSHLFDGVDERQVARALQIGATRASANGFQYIVTMNSDAIPKEGFEGGFRLEDYYLDVRLSDATETGGLFGLRFD